MSNMVFQQMEVGQHAVFSYLVGDKVSGEAFVVDPADNIDDIVKNATQQSLTIQYIVNTHGHVDHIMGNAIMKSKTHAKIIIHEAEAEYLQKIGDFWLELFNAQKSPPADIVVSEGDIVQVGLQKWHIIHTPGHTPGGICLYNDIQHICISGDTLFVGSIGRTDGPKSSYQQLYDAIHTKLFTLPDEVIVYPGHNYGLKSFTTLGQEKVANPFLNSKMYY